MTNGEARRHLADIRNNYGDCPTYWIDFDGSGATWSNQYIDDHLDELPDSDDEWLVDTGDGHINPVVSIQVMVVNGGKRNGKSRPVTDDDFILNQREYFAVHFAIDHCHEYGDEGNDA